MAKRLGIYIYNGAEVIDWAGPLGVFAVARRLDPELDVFLVGDCLAPVTATGTLTSGCWESRRQGLNLW